MQELTETEKQFVAIALQRLMIRQGNLAFDIGLRIADKLDIEDKLMESLQSWLNFENKEEESDPQTN